MKKYIILIIFVLSLLSVSAFQYPNMGGENFNFSLTPRGLFNAEIEDVDQHVEGIAGTYREIPYLVDVDNNSRNEIVVFTSAQIEVINGSTLTSVSAVSHNCGTPFSTWIQDLNNDGNTEIIMACPNVDDLLIFSWKGGDFVLNVTHDMPNCCSNNIHTQVACDDTDECLVAYSNAEDIRAGAGELFTAQFNMSKIGSRQEQFTDEYTIWCNPYINAPVVKDYELDGNEEIIMSFIRPDFENDADYYIFYFEIDKDNKEANLDLQISRDGYGSFNANDDCYNVSYNFSTRFSPPFVHDLTSNSGLETVLAYQINEDEYNMRMYDKYGNSIDVYPEILDSDGHIISNIVLADVFSDSGYNDFCVLGYRQSDQQLDLTCASERSDAFFETEEFFFDASNLFNVTYSATTQEHDLALHEVQMSTALTNNADLSEFLTTYGVFSVEFGLLSNDLILEYENPFEDGSVMAYDLDGTGLSDIFVYTNNALYKLDDTFVNSPAEIESDSTINPAHTSVWKVNTSVQVQLHVTDPDLDTVCGNAYLYYGDANQQNGTEQCGASGITFLYLFTADKIIANGVLRVEANDTVNRELQSLNIPFTVAQNGIEFGDATSTLDGLTGVDDTNNVTSQGNQYNNSLDQIMTSGQTATGLGSTVLWAIFMAIVAVMVWMNKNSELDDRKALGLIGIIEVILLIVGTKLGYVGVGMIILIALALAGYAGLLVAKRFNLTSGGE